MAWVKHKENRILNLNRITDIGVGQLYNSNDKLEWFIIFRDNNENQCTSRPYISKEECEKALSCLIESLSRDVPYIDMTNISQDRIHMTEEYLLSKGFTENKDTTRNFVAELVSSNKQIIVRQGYTNKLSCNWYVHVDNQSMDTIGSLDFEYIDEFESFLKLCGVSYGEK